MRRTLAGPLLLLVFAAVAGAQIPRVGEIDFYGIHKLTPEKIMSAANLRPGDRLPASKGDLEQKIEDLPDVVLASVQAICCDGRTATLFVGIEERGAPHASFRSEPAGNATLPQEIIDLYYQFLTAVQRAALRGDSAEDLTAGHSSMDDPAAHAIQEKFAAFAAANLDLLRAIIRSSSEPDQRAVAAAVIGYAPKKHDVVNDLQFALDDPDEPVRSNAIRALAAIAVLASKQPALGLKVSPTWFIELLHSVVLSDRVEATKALVILTDHQGEAAIEQIKERALPDLAEMARWKTLRYALPPFLLLGRVAGLSDAEAQQQWAKGNREPVIEKALSLAPEQKNPKRNRG